MLFKHLSNCSKFISFCKRSRFRNMSNVFFLFLLPYVLCARQIDTFYGPIEVQENVLLELMDSPVFQRLKNIHQYGVA